MKMGALLRDMVMGVVLVLFWWLGRLKGGVVCGLCQSRMEGDEGWTIGLRDAQEVRHVGVIWYLCGRPMAGLEQRKFQEWLHPIRCCWASPILPGKAPSCLQLEAGQFHKHDVGRGGSCRGAPHWVLGLCVLAVLACCLAL